MLELKMLFVAKTCCVFCMSNSIYPGVIVFEQQNTNQGTEWSTMEMFATVPFERRELRTLKIRINVREVH